MIFSKYCSVRGAGFACVLALSVGWFPIAMAGSVNSPIVSFNTLPALQATTPIPGSAHIPGDFNGDGTSDLLWFNYDQSQMGYWTMNGNDPKALHGISRIELRSYNITPGYFVGAVSDFNNDGYADLVFTSAKRDLWLWTNDQKGSFKSIQIGSYPEQWQLIGAGDVNGDGYDDLLWLDPSECKFAYWTMRGGVRTGYKIIDIACGYYPVSVGYYSPSSQLSILWTSPARDVYIWDSIGSSFKSYDLTPDLSSFLAYEAPWFLGGGSAGSNMTINVYGSEAALYAGARITRLFDAEGNQIKVSHSQDWTGGSFGYPGPAGFLIRRGSMPATALFGINQADGIIDTEGFRLDRAPAFLPFSAWNYPEGWYVVGAPINGTTAPPWL